MQTDDASVHFRLQGAVFTSFHPMELRDLPIIGVYPYSEHRRQAFQKFKLRFDLQSRCDACGTALRASSAGRPDGTDEKPSDAAGAKAFSSALTGLAAAESRLRSAASRTFCF